ncbi:MAG: DUF3177 family protein [Cyanobacteria bacterium J06614_10]
MLRDPSSVLSLVWTDYRLSLLVAVFIPLTLLIWSWVKKAEAISALLTIYWRVATLIVITYYLMIGGLSIGFVTAILARVLIPLSLWFWADLNEEIREQPKRSLNLGFNAWRWAITAYCAVGVALRLLFVSCAFSSAALSSDRCQAWLAPAMKFRETFHSGLTPGFLGFWGILGLVIYALYLAYFLFVKLGRQGRSALNQ